MAACTNPWSLVNVHVYDPWSLNCMSLMDSDPNRVPVVPIVNRPPSVILVSINDHVTLGRGTPDARHMKVTLVVSSLVSG